MRLLLVVLIISAVGCLGADAKRKRKFEGDFEFAEEDDNTKSQKSSEKKRWIHDPSSDLCRPLNCKKKEICLLEDTFTAVCVSRKELKKNGDIVVPKQTTKAEDPKNEDEDDDVFYDTEDDPDEEDEAGDDLSDASSCKPCPVVKPIFLCGSDNRTYSSLCRLDYHNCIHRTGIKVSCKGFCPCKVESEVHLRKKQRQSERLNSFMNKYKATLNKSGLGASAINGGKALQPPTKSDVYTFTPQDFKVENKHYKYIKYTKYNNKKNNENNMLLAAEDKERLRGYNEVIDNKIYSNSIHPSVDGAVKQQCSPNALQAMGNRLLDWFSVVMADSSKRRRPRNKSKVHFPSLGCQGEVRWMFQHLDSNADGRLTLQELYNLEHDQSEVCLKPFLQQCDVDRDVVVTASEWCRCFLRTERPCVAVKHKITPDLLGAYVPDCDNQGYYKPIQCHNSIGMCWCVDKHGVEFANTRTHAKPNCESVMNKGNNNNNKNNDLSKQINNNAIGQASDDEDDDQDVEGSADHPDDY